VSESGQSEYFVDLNLSKQTGVLRYRYFGQDVSYAVSSLVAQKGQIVGTAYFKGCATGEVRGSPVEFKYDWSNDTFVDGAVEFECSNLQDGDLLKIPNRATPAQQL